MIFKKRLNLIVAGIIVLIWSGCAGFRAKSKPLDKIEPIRCHFTFKNITQEDDQIRIDNVINRFAVDDVKKTGPASSPDYVFSVPNLDVLNKLHPQIAYTKAGKKKVPQQVFTDRNAFFSVEYSMLDLAASLEVTVTFHITPGADLFLKIEEKQPEENITDKVDATGKVRLKTKIHKGQEFIYARTIADNVERYIKINIYSQAVENITKEEYPK